METLTKYAALIVLTATAIPVNAEEYPDYNSKIVETVHWLSKNKSGLGYSLASRYTENLSYGPYVFRSSGGTKTMCVAAVFETIIRSLSTAQSASGQNVPLTMLPGKTLDGSTALNLLPYAFQYKSSATFPEYGRKFSAGIGDAFVLFGIGRYVTFDTAKEGDFIYFNRSNGGGHAVVFMGRLDATGALTTNPSSTIGFRYFSAQEGGTKGMGYRDAFFGDCPAAETKFKKDCGVIRSDKRSLFAVSRLHDPKHWYTSFSAIRVERFFKGDKIDKIYADEPAFRSRGKQELAEAESRAKEYARNGLFPLIVPAIAGESKASEVKLEPIAFDEEFGPDFREEILQ